ncbi:MarR family winged helix-turn-helix transcriptional regulator [Crenalkalicoccus roseus]|uniref:MarR family winged helix-turn-helix transcriptional regulator n=1 Tax=Crenalkalicoccus roseus TaxID=1485588 RepID=UPI001081B24B|nr:MarR family winged helix-turn-helix transcriptional regulator [Crenalkalicoccus roseus]
MSSAVSLRHPPPGRNAPESHRTLGWLLRLPYAVLAERVYGGLAARGFPDIRPAHGSLFRHIRPEGSRLTELAEQAQMTKQSMAYLVQSLSEGGYVETVPDPEDGRARLVRLTPRGRQVLETLLALSAEAEAALAARLGARKMARLRGLLEELAERLEAER